MVDMLHGIFVMFSYFFEIIYSLGITLKIVMRNNICVLHLHIDFSYVHYCVLISFDVDAFVLSSSFTVFIGTVEYR